ncbi:phosphotransferase family protein [Acidocella sp. MX-AZ02]|nr:phosphotransferase family protein [Acidocella sp. MX-AZ02]
METDILPSYLVRRRWFPAKDQDISEVRLTRMQLISEHLQDVLLTEVEVEVRGHLQRFNLPLGISWDGETNAPLPSQLALARVRQGRRLGYLTDAFALDSFPALMVRALRAGQTVQVADGATIVSRPEAPLAAIELPAEPEIRRLSAEQSNSSLTLAQKIVVKLIRRVNSGINPEVEMMRHLTKQGFANTPSLLGEIMMTKPDGEVHSIVVAQSFQENQGDAWQYTLNYLDRFIDQIGIGGRNSEDEADLMNAYASFARALGTRLAELHEVLARPCADKSFHPVTVSRNEAKKWGEAAFKQFEAALAAIEKLKEYSDEQTARSARFLRDCSGDLQKLLPSLALTGEGTLATRVHGDFHLGQVLVNRGDAWIIDFEGEPSKPLAERRAKSAPARDVAGLLRSFDYAIAVAQQGQKTLEKAQAEAPLHRFCETMRAEFSGAYTETRQQRQDELLQLFLVEKAAYEICYEAANRPSWTGIPIRGLAAIASRILVREEHDA